MNELIAAGLGIVCAWFTVGIVVRVWRGRYFVLIAAVWLVSAEAATVYSRVKNNTGGSVNVVIKHANGTVRVSGPLTQSGDTQCIEGSGFSGAYDTTDGVIVTFDGHVWSACGGDGSPGAPNLFRYTGPPALVSTNHVAEVAWTNNAAGADFTLKVYTNGVLYTNVTGFYGTGDDFTRGLTNVAGEGVAFTWEIVGPGGAENDYSPVVVASGSSTGTPSYDTGLPPAFNGSGNLGDPFVNVPEQDSGTIPADSAVAARQNSEGIIRALQLQGGQDTERLLAGLEKLRTNGTSEMDMTWTNILKDISTNTANLNTNAFEAYTNSFVSEIQSLIASSTNDFNSSSTAALIDSGISDVLTTLTNQEAVSLSSNPLVFEFQSPSGSTMRANFGLSSVGDPAWMVLLKGQLVGWCNFLRAWFLKLIPFVVFWIFTYQTLQWERVALLNLGYLPKSFEVSPSKLAGKVVNALIASVVIGFVVGFIPTALVSYTQSGLMSGASAAIPSVAGHIDDPSWAAYQWIDAIKAFFNATTELIPYTSVVFLAAHYGAFMLYGERLLMMVLRIFARIGWATAALAFCCVPQLSATEVELWNFAGTNVIVSNIVTEKFLSVPPGGPMLLNLAAAEYDVAGTSVEIPEIEDRFVFRIEGGGISTSIAASEWSWFWGFYLTGVPIFGLIAMVAAVRDGVTHATGKRIWPGSD